MRAVRRRHGAAVHDVRGAAGAVAGVVRRGRGGRVPLPEAPVEGRAPARRRAAPLAAALDPAALSPAQRDLRRQVHETLAKVTHDIGTRRTFNTAIAAVMELMNALAQVRRSQRAGRARVMQEALEIVVLGLSPVVPHACHALWQRTRARRRRHRRSAGRRSMRPRCVRDAIEIVVQVNGKLRGRVTVAAGARRGGRARGGARRRERAALRGRQADPQVHRTCPASSRTWWSEACAAG